MFYHYLNSAIGKLLLVKNKQELVSILFENQGFENAFAKYDLKMSQDSDVSKMFSEEEKQIKDFLNGDIKSFDLPIKLGTKPSFRKTVQEYLPKIKYGQTKSYKEIADNLDNPNAFRAVGSACASNPLPLILPCHRVLKSDGSIGDYAGGIEAKNFLLELEKN